MKLKTLILFVGAVFMISCSKSNPKSSIIPIPSTIQLGEGSYQLLASAKVSVNNEALSEIANLLPFENSSESAIQLLLNEEEGETEIKGAYLLKVSQDGIILEANSEEGIFYGVQSLLQLMSQNKSGSSYDIPFLEISDSPRFAYRGMHLDVSRHFYSASFVKKYIDLLASYKMNRFHWHLTDGTAWRLEIKKYPLLTQKTAFRPERTWKEFWDGDRKFAEEGDENVYGGYYTQEEVREIVAYAASKYITIIPEIEMPGHSEEVFVAYPELSCSKEAYVNGDFCAGNDDVFEFIDNVLTEVVELFPSEYIHIGGDEASKSAWKTCPLCQKRMRQHNLNNVDELQSYFIKRVEKIVESKGRKIIGWDEILEGGLAPSATVMSWRGEAGGVKAAKMGHNVVMVPGAYCYLDAYQADPQTEPGAIGGYLPLRKVYSYRPIPKELSLDEQKHILGIQGALWVEYISTEEHVEYMLLPRMIALSEIAWSDEKNLDWNSFKHRLFNHFPSLEERGYNYHTPTHEIEMIMKVNHEKEEIIVEFETEQDAPKIRYTLDGTEPNSNSELYTKTFSVTGSKQLKAAILESGKIMQPVLDKPLNYHKGIGKRATYNTKWGTPYPAGGDTALIDGYRGGMGYGDGKWQGFTNNIDIVIDLGESQDLNAVSAKFMQLIAPGVYMPSYIEVETSEDGGNFELAFKDENDISMEIEKLIFKDFKGELKGKKVRYIRFFAKNPKGYIFTDEIIIE